VRRVRLSAAARQSTETRRSAFRARRPYTPALHVNHGVLQVPQTFRNRGQRFRRAIVPFRLSRDHLQKGLDASFDRGLGAARNRLKAGVTERRRLSDPRHQGVQVEISAPIRE
jgi:hypothetical protein